MAEKQQLFVSNITANYVAKNKYEKEVGERVKVWNYVCLNDKDKFFESLVAWIKGIHNKYPRCGTLSVTISKSAFKGEKHYIHIGAILILIELIPINQTALYGVKSSVALNSNFDPYPEMINA